MEGNREPEEPGRAEGCTPVEGPDGPVPVEQVVLPEGTKLCVRIVLPSDKPHFRTGITKLSRESRYFRFLTGKAELSDCLLYTSPSPRDLSTSRMPSSA